MYFIGVIISMFSIVRLADLYGRKWPIIICQFIQLPVYFWMFYMQELYEAYICIFLFGIGFGGSVSINSLYMQEFLMKEHRALTMMVG